MARGGRRNGSPGKAYGNRSDLQGGKAPVMRVPGQGYGAQAAQVSAQQAVPMGSPQLPSGDGQLPSMAQAIEAVPSLTAPTQRPGEPVTAGLPSGPGPGPDPSMGAPEPPEVSQLRALYMQFPYEGLRRLLDTYNGGRQ